MTSCRRLSIAGPFSMALVFTVAPPGAGAQDGRLIRDYVMPVPGNPAASGDRLFDRLAATTGTADSPRIIRIAPGVFDLSGRSLAMKPWVDIEGSGQGMTTVRSSVESVGTVIGASDAELRDLRVENTGATFATGLGNSAAGFRAARVTSVATGGSTLSAGVVNSVAGGEYTDVTARGAGPAGASGFSTQGGRVRGLRATALGGGITYAVFNTASSGEQMDVTAEAESTVFAGGIRNEGGGPLLRNVRVRAQGNPGNGIVNGASSAAVIDGAVITAISTGVNGAFGIRNEFGSPRIANALIVASSPSGGGGVTSGLGAGMPVISNVVVQATGGGTAIGVRSSDDTITRIDRSTITGDGASIEAFGATSTVRAGASRLEGPASGSGTLQCAASYDASFTPLDAACVPVP